MKSDRELEDAVYYAALNVSDPAQRNHFLDQACAGRDELRAAVEELLAGEAGAERLFAKGGAALSLAAEYPPSASSAVAASSGARSSSIRATLLP